MFVVHTKHSSGGPQSPSQVVDPYADPTVTRGGVKNPSGPDIRQKNRPRVVVLVTGHVIICGQGT